MSSSNPLERVSSSRRQLEKESIFKIGNVFSVSGRTITIKVNKDKNLSHIIYDGDVIKNVSAGSYVKIEKGFTTLIAKIEGEYIEEDKYYPSNFKNENLKISRFLRASLFGHYEGDSFKQGIKEMPLIDNECYILDRVEFQKLHNFSKEGDKTLRIGVLTEEPAQEIRIGIDKLFASHIGIFGNTGSGKSNTLARIYSNLFESSSDFHNFTSKSTFLVIDFNGEYTGEKVLTNNKKVIKLNTHKATEDIAAVEKYYIPEGYIKNAEILSVLLDATEKTQQPFLARALRNKYLEDATHFVPSIQKTIKNILDKEDRGLGVGTIIDFLRRLEQYVKDTDRSRHQDFISKLSSNLGQVNGGAFYWATAAPANYNSNYGIYDKELGDYLESITLETDLLNEIQLRILLSYYHEISSGQLNQEHIGPVINRMRGRFNMLTKVIKLEDDSTVENVIVLSLKNVNTEMKKIIPLLVCKQLYEQHKTDYKNDKGITKSLHILIDEAHNILSENSERENETWKDYRLETFEEIIKEGRKFGAFLTISSQRPNDISPTIISQLHNYFIHRLLNVNDINAIERAVAYLDKLSFDSIPILPAGNCFVAGLATDIPIKVDIDILELDRQPNSATIRLQETWS